MRDNKWLSTLELAVVLPFAWKSANDYQRIDHRNRAAAALEDGPEASDHRGKRRAGRVGFLGWHGDMGWRRAEVVVAIVEFG